MTAPSDNPPAPVAPDARPPAPSTQHTPDHSRAMRYVFLPAAAISLVFVVLAAVFPSQTADALQAANTTVVNGIGWYYVLLVTSFVAFALYAAVLIAFHVLAARGTALPLPEPVPVTGPVPVVAAAGERAVTDGQPGAEEDLR